MFSNDSSIGGPENEILATGWKDNIVSFQSTKTNATNEPLWGDIGNGLFAYKFVPGNEVFTLHHITHDYKMGTDGYPHVHFISDAAMNIGDTIVWEFNYRIAKSHSQGESLTTVPSIQIIITYVATGTEIPGEHILVECEDVDAFDLLEPDTVVMGRVKLLSTTTAGNIFGLMCDIHYQIDRLATISKKPDFNT